MYAMQNKETNQNSFRNVEVEHLHDKQRVL